MKMLWLCSWYGDFIERQAKALALHMEVDVIHVVQNFNFLEKETTLRVEEKQHGQLYSSVYFIPLPNTSISFWQKILFNKQYQALYKKLIADLVNNQLKSYTQNL